MGFVSSQWWRFWRAVARLFDDFKFARRATLLWALWLITVVSLRVTEPEIITELNTASGVVVTGVIGILATVVGFYLKSRERDDNRTEDRNRAGSDRPAGR